MVVAREDEEEGVRDNEYQGKGKHERKGEVRYSRQRRMYRQRMLSFATMQGAVLTSAIIRLVSPRNNQLRAETKHKVTEATLGISVTR